MERKNVRMMCALTCQSNLKRLGVVPVVIPSARGEQVKSVVNIIVGHAIVPSRIFGSIASRHGFHPAVLEAEESIIALSTVVAVTLAALQRYVFGPGVTGDVVQCRVGVGAESRAQLLFRVDEDLHTKDKGKEDKGMSRAFSQRSMQFDAGTHR